MRKVRGEYRQDCKGYGSTKGGKRERERSKGEGERRRKEEDPTCPPTKGRWSTEPPPRMVCHPSVRRFRAYARQDETHARLLTSASSTRWWTNLCGSIVASLLLTDQSAIGVYLIRQCQCRVTSHRVALQLVSYRLSSTRLEYQ